MEYEPKHVHPYNVVYDNDREYDGHQPQHRKGVIHPLYVPPKNKNGEGEENS